VGGVEDVEKASAEMHENEGEKMGRNGSGVQGPGAGLMSGKV
jgi:hypothetical protein